MNAIKETPLEEIKDRFSKIVTFTNKKFVWQSEVEGDSSYSWKYKTKEADTTSSSEVEQCV